MSQTVQTLISGRLRTLNLPDSRKYLLKGVRWGCFDEIFSPAFWAAQIWLMSEYKISWQYRIGNSLKEEIVACLLGGYGVKSEVGLAVFYNIRTKGMLDDVATETDFYKVLSSPILIQNKYVKYRYPHQRSRYLSQALYKLSKEVPPEHDDLELREWLLTFPGIGLKTASWITRNWLDSDQVAILDIHIYRAGILAGIFNFSENPNYYYLILEKKLIEFSKALGVRLSLLDVVIWDQMRQMQSLALSTLKNKMIN